MRAPQPPEPELFTSSPQVHTTDVDEATDLLNRVYLPVKLSPSRSARLDMRMKAAELPMLTAGYLHFGADVSIGGDDIPAYYIEAPLSGTAVNRWRDGCLEKTAQGSAAVFSPGTPCDLSWSNDCGQVCLKVTEPQMRRHLEGMLGRPVRKRITFARGMPLNGPTSGSWFDLVRILAREAGRSDGVLGHQLALANMQQLLIDGLLSIQPHNYAEALFEDHRAASSAVVKRATDLVHAYPENPWSIAELARATAVSPSALQKAFQRAGQPPPMTSLRQVRLRRVHAELARSSAGATTVTRTAGRWGFVHMGRFAQQYRQMFGEVPSETLRAGVSSGNSASASASITARRALHPRGRHPHERVANRSVSHPPGNGG